MAFSSDVRTELAEAIPKSLHCRIAMLAGIVTLDGKLKYEDGARIISIRMEQDIIVDTVKRLLEQVFGFTGDDYVTVPRSSSGARLRIEAPEKVEKMILTLKLTAREGRLDVDEMVFTRLCCRNSFLRGAYMAAGSISNPENSYQLEIVAGRPSVTGQLLDLFNGLGLKGHTVIRRGQSVIYLKGADDISELLGQMGASRAMMELENIRILKGIRNTINREVNCDTANITKITDAAGRSIDDIRHIDETIGIPALPAELQEIARLSMENPELSLQELGELLSPPLGKSGVNHRLRKIRKIAADPDMLRKS